MAKKQPKKMNTTLAVFGTALLLIVVLIVIMFIISTRGKTEKQNKVIEAPVGIISNLQESGRVAWVKLYFRQEESNYLLTQNRELEVLSSETTEQAAIQALIDGPDLSGPTLTRLLPESTEIVSVEGDGDTLYITFNKELLYWPMTELNQQSMYEKLRLMVASIANTILDIGNYANVQIRVDSEGTGYGQPLTYKELGYENQADKALPLLYYDHSVVFSPQKAIESIMMSVQNRQWRTVYNNLAERDSRGVLLEGYTTVYEQFREITYDIHTWEIVEVTQAADGTNVLVRMNLGYVTENGEEFYREQIPVTLRYENDVWKIPIDDLMRILETQNSEAS